MVAEPKLSVSHTDHEFPWYSYSQFRFMGYKILRHVNYFLTKAPTFHFSYRVC